ncbi:MAG TPA: Wzz/FepE/Etk N-terminal domain-containing protein, partial [Chloroflexota bacterium]|nr:Wzz/FepE/Etk N-terminal domain-containing protein [Chloroflexota bacterium]
MELRKYWFVITKWALLIVGVTLAGAVASFVYSRSSAPVYSASTTILVNQAQNPATPDYNSILTSERLTQTYSQLIKTRPILARAIKDLNLPLSTTELDRVIDVKVIRDTQLIQLSAESGNPVTARDIANTLAKDFIDDNQTQRLGETATSQKVLQQQVSDLADQIKALDGRLAAARTASGDQSSEAQQLQTLLSQDQVTYSQLLKAQDDMSLAESRVLDQIRVVEPAETPDTPIRPRVLLNVLLAVAAGLVVGIGLAFLLEYLDDTVKSPDDALEVTGLMSLGTISRMPGNDGGSRRLVDELPRHSP